MYELIFNPGVQFELFKLHGLLTYIFTRAGKPEKRYVLSEADFEDANESNNSEPQSVVSGRPGSELSAVGIRLRLLKNDGLLQMEFEGTDGSSAKWTFEGLNIENGKTAVASATTQTLLDQTNCTVCGQKQVAQGETADCGTQTSHQATEDSGTQTNTALDAQSGSGMESAQTTNVAGIPAMISTATQSDIAIEPEISDSAYINNFTDENTGRPSKKRKASPDPQAELIHKCAKSKHDSAPWPRYIYMDCWREKPLSKTDLGKLIIDIKKATVTYEDKHGKDYAQITELKQVDLRAPDTKVVFHALGDRETCRFSEQGFDGATRMVEIMRMAANGNPVKFISLHCLAPLWRIWYLDPAASSKKKIFITDPEIMVDMLVHCIDRTSGRDAVHDPDADHRWATEEAEVAKAPFQGGPWSRYRGRVGKEWTAAEKENRQIAKTLAKVYQPDKLGHEVKIPY